MWTDAHRRRARTGDGGECPSHRSPPRPCPGTKRAGPRRPGGDGRRSPAGKIPAPGGIASGPGSCGVGRWCGGVCGVALGRTGPRRSGGPPGSAGGAGRWGGGGPCGCVTWCAGECGRGSRGLDPGPGRVFPSGPGVEATGRRRVCAVFHHRACAWRGASITHAGLTTVPNRAHPSAPVRQPRRSRCRGPASSVRAGHASRSGGCARGSVRAPCRPRSGCARGRRRCRTAS